MNIPKILNFNAKSEYTGQQASNNSCYTTNYGLKMAAPIKKDTVSFKAKESTLKNIGDKSSKISNSAAKQLIKIVEPAHNKFVKFMYEVFGDVMSTPEKKGLFTYKERLKSEFSIREKSASLQEMLKKDGHEELLRKYNTMKKQDFYLEEMKDISGNAFILDDARGFQVFTKRLIELIKNRKINVVDLEYYRIPPINKGRKSISFDSLNTNYIGKIASAIDDVKGNIKATPYEQPSPAGYSGLHITVKHEDGNYTEIQVMTRAMWNLKEIENLYYKMKYGKAVNPKYDCAEPFWDKLKPVDEYATDKEKKPHAVFMEKLKQYTKEAYIERLKRPYEDRKTFLSPTDPELSDFDFNKISKKIENALSSN